MAMEQTMSARTWGWASPVTDAEWDAVYAELLPRVHDFFRYRVGPGPDAEDLTSVTFEKAWQSRHRYRRDIASFQTWVFAIARNTAIDHFRARRVHAPIEEAEALPGGRTPEELAEKRSDAERLSRLLAALPERERELIALKFGAGLTNREIARSTRLGESNVGTILHRTIAGLRAGWNEGESR